MIGFCFTITPKTWYMKKINFLLLIFIINVVSVNATGSPSPKINASADPSASLQKMWIDYGVTEDNRFGMMMHVSFTVYNMKNIGGFLGFYFKYNDGKANSYIKHRRLGDKYHTADGTLSTGVKLTPTYDVSVYNDVQVFFPYDEFGLDPGTYDLTIDVQFNYVEGGGVAWLKLYDIEYTAYDNSRGPNNKKAAVNTKAIRTSGPRATFDTMWVDFDVKENDILGMRLHFKFTAYDMKDTLAALAVYFEYNDERGGFLRDKNDQYASSAGDVALYKDINPGYNPATYDDLQVFMPYSELDLAPGTYHLLMDTKLIYRRGGLISNFVYQPFRYTEPAQ